MRLGVEKVPLGFAQFNRKAGSGLASAKGFTSSSKIAVLIDANDVSNETLLSLRTTRSMTEALRFNFARLMCLLFAGVRTKRFFRNPSANSSGVSREPSAFQVESPSLDVFLMGNVEVGANPLWHEQ
jgi:hypothetical protein